MANSCNPPFEIWDKGCVLPAEENFLTGAWFIIESLAIILVASAIINAIQLRSGIMQLEYLEIRRALAREANHFAEQSDLAMKNLQSSLSEQTARLNPFNSKTNDSSQPPCADLKQPVSSADLKQPLLEQSFSGGLYKSGKFKTLSKAAKVAEQMQKRGITSKSRSFEMLSEKDKIKLSVEDAVNHGRHHWVRVSTTGVVDRVFPRVHVDNIAGVGLPLFYNSHILPFMAALFAMVLNPGNWVSTTEETALAEANHMSLFFLWVLMFGHAWLYARLQRWFSVWYESNNSTMQDYTLKLTNLPCTITNEMELAQKVRFCLLGESHPNDWDEEALPADIEQTEKELATIKQEKNKAAKLEDFDSARDSKAREKKLGRHLARLKEKFLPSVKEVSELQVESKVKGSGAGDVAPVNTYEGWEQDSLSLRFETLNFDSVAQEGFTKELLRELIRCGVPEEEAMKYNVVLRKGSVVAEVNGYVHSIMKLRLALHSQTVVVMGSTGEIIEDSDVVGVSIAYNVSKDYWDVYHPMIENILMDLEAEYEKASIHMAKENQARIEQENVVRKILDDLGQDTDEGIAQIDENMQGFRKNLKEDQQEFLKLWRGGKIQGSGSAFIVFRSKIACDRIRDCASGFWLPRNMTVKAKILKNNLVYGVTKTKKAGRYVHWHTLAREVHVESSANTSREWLPEGTRINDEFEYSGRKGVVGELQANLNAIDDHEDILIRAEQLVGVESVAYEPTSALWPNFGATRMAEQKRGAVKSIVKTFLTFVAIYIVIWLPWEHFILEPYAEADKSPTFWTCQFGGWIMGIANAIIGTVMWTTAWGIGYDNQYTLDLWCLGFNMMWSMANWAYGLFISLHHLVPEDLRELDITKKSELSQRLFQTLIPGALFSNFILGQVIGTLLPFAFNLLLLKAIFVWKCFPSSINKILSAIVPGNPPTDKPLSRRSAEIAMEPGALGLCWDYGNIVVNPTVCFLVLFTFRWEVFPWLFVNIVFMYLWHRFVCLNLRRKQMHSSVCTDAAVVRWWSLPVSLVAAAWALCGYRLGYHDAFVIPVIFCFSLLLYLFVLDRVERPFDHESKDFVDEIYEKVEERMIYSWFNTNPIHVLKARFLPLDSLDLPKHVRDRSMIPFIYGKEYLLRSPEAMPSTQTSLLEEFEYCTTWWFTDRHPEWKHWLSKRFRRTTDADGEAV